MVAYVEDGRLVLEHRAHVLERLPQDVLAAAEGSRHESGSVVDDLLADRRADAAAEAEESPA